MRKWAGLSVVLLVATLFACGWFVWDFFQLAGRPLGTFEFGEHRVVRIWSEQSERDWPIGPVPVLYEIRERDAIIVPATYICSDRGNRFEFRVGFADNNNLACVCQVNPEVKNFDSVIVFDARTGESWPRAWKMGPVDRQSWRERFRMLQEANPNLPIKFD